MILGDFGSKWILVDVLWATISGVTIGVAAGVALAHVGWKLRSKPHEHALMDDFLGLGLIGVVYGLTVMVNGWGFLAVFFAAVALRQTELKLAKAAQDAFDGSKTQQAARIDANARPELEPAQTVSQGSLVFKEHLERLSEVVLVLLIGGTLYLNSWTCGSGGAGPVPVRDRAPDQCHRRTAGHEHHLADARHDRLVRRARDRLALLPDVRDRKRLAGGAVAAIDTNDTDRRYAFHSVPRNQRQTR